MRPALISTLAVTLAAAAVDTKLFDRLEYRNIGPANMGGRIADIEGVPGNPNLVYVASASGGLFRTQNGGATWTPLFDRQGAISIGDIALDPSNPEVIWLGGGESNVRNSVSFGDGVYKSTDGGKTWRHLGLKETERVSRVLVHPRNPDVAWVGALGRAFGRNAERGVFLTTDGGRTWQKTLYVDDGHGVADLDIDPANPNILYAAMWRFERKPWTHTSGSEQGGVFQSVDGGRAWKKLTSGLPKLMGRIGVKVAPSNPNVVYVIAESNEGTLFRSDDRGETFRQVSRDREIVSRGFYYADLRVDPRDENRVYALATSMMMSIDGGRAFRRVSRKTHPDYQALWIDPGNPNRLWQGQDGGIAVSHDRGENWDVVDNLPLGQFYQISADNRQPFYFVHGGLQDNANWTGPSRTREPAGILNDDWRMVSFGDGFHAINHPDDPDLYLSESQGGMVVRTDLRTREQQMVTPQPRSSAGGPAGALKYRFNWNSPLIPSPHDKNTVYLGGNVVFESRDFGKTWRVISPDLSTNDPEKLKSAGGPVWHDNSTAENYCTVLSLAESPARTGLIWAGTDDGNLQVTRDGGKSWTNLIRNVTGVAANSPVSHIEPSRASADVAYVSFDRHMLDDFRPYVFRTRDGGRTWTNITGNLPEKAHVWVVREDPKNPSLLYAGTEQGLYVSWTGGEDWRPLGLKNLPRVAVHDLMVHPRENDLILATHGRSIWILDDATAVQQMNDTIAQRDLHVFETRPAIRHTTRFTRIEVGNREFTGANPVYGALITYYLKQKPDDKTRVVLEILDASGKVIREVTNIPKEAGVNRAAWDLRLEPPKLRRPPTEQEEMFGRANRGPQALPGVYTARLVAGDQKQETRVEIRLDPTLKIAAAELEMQHASALKLREMSSATNDALRTLDGLKEQLDSIEEAMKDRTGAAPAEIASYRKQIDAMIGRLGRSAASSRLDSPAGLAENLASLLQSVDGVNAAPTEAQRALLTEYEADYKPRIAEAAAFFTKTVPEWNRALTKLGAPVLVTGR